MSRLHPDRGTVYGALSLAVRAPSVHNTQPWLWKIGDTSVHLYADPDRQVPATDPDARDLVVSCGAALNHFRVALRAEGWATTVERTPNPADPWHLAAIEMLPRTPIDEDVRLASAILRRHTDRRRMSGWTVPTSHLDVLMQAAGAAGALLVPIAEPVHQAKTLQAIATAAETQEGDPRYVAEMREWSGRGTFADEGVLASSTPVDSGPPLRAFPHGTLRQPDTDPNQPEGAVLLVLATPDDDVRGRLRAGEAASAALLAATDLGLASCPLSQALEIADTRRFIENEILDDVAVPQLLLRVGWAPLSAEPLPVSPRRPMDTVVAALDPAFDL